MRRPPYVTKAVAATVAALLVMALVAACSPGTVPGTPTPITFGAGGGRYNGTITTRRVGGNFIIGEGTQTISLSLVTQGTDQLAARFQSPTGNGTLTGVLDGTLADGTFQATLLVSTPAQQGSTSVTCEGRGAVSGSLSGANMTWSSPQIEYQNCSDLKVVAEVQLVAVSPIPEKFPSRANVIITIVGGTNVGAGTCPGGAPGYPFTVEIAETAGVNVNFDSTFEAEERRSTGSSKTTLDTPFTELRGGSRRTYSACSTVPGTYQAFFRGTDANGNVLRFASPIVTMGGFSRD